MGAEKRQHDEPGARGETRRDEGYVCVSTCGTGFRAGLVRGMLTSRGIDARVRRRSRLEADMLHRYHVLVRDEDFARAQAALLAAERADEAPEAPACINIRPGTPPPCPACGADETEALPLSRREQRLAQLTLGMARRFIRPRYACSCCRHVWKRNA